ncbi:hypothetical protein P1P75_09010 [Streptomyces sp. ID05-39B]|uniref:hypothetical protein n=1 Tax=Streptomyces sp. ID05-39B TaxID=3028664 RepID=UPI0029B745E7|nr:hypothetical protein [Streptomyces sp. ID05-39B]MDX3526575.1 hypothetical protein [Streptomyces sp. ID05-39B]
MSSRPFPGRRGVPRGSLAAPAALPLPVGLGAAPALACRDGEADIDGESGELTVRLHEQDGTVLFTRSLQPGLVGQ